MIIITALFLRSRPKGLGAQNAVAGGGRSTAFIKNSVEDAAPCTGFSIGVERLLTSIESQDAKAFDAIKAKKAYFAPLEDHAEILRFCREKALLLREAGIRPETGHGVFSLSQHLKKANQLGLRFMVIAGPDELRKKVVIVKDLEKEGAERSRFRTFREPFKKGDEFMLRTVDVR